VHKQALMKLDKLGEGVDLAPIVLFVYNRPWHTKKTVEALQKNSLASDSELFIYSDGAKDEAVKPAVDEVREYINSINGFKTITVIERDKNWGLANSIIDGVTTIVNQYGKVIVLEDDLVTSQYFLKFMNDALDFYQYEKKVWHISGWNYPINTDDFDDVFLWRLMNCWGWATWADKWQHYEKDIDKTIAEFSQSDIKRFNLDGAEDFFSQVIANKNKKIKTWAIFWYVTIFKETGLCLGPSQSFVENIGHDGSGEHCGKSESYSVNLCFKKDSEFTRKLVEKNSTLTKIQQFYQSQKRSLLVRVISKLSRILIGSNFFK